MNFTVIILILLQLFIFIQGNNLRNLSNISIDSSLFTHEISQQNSNSDPQITQMIYYNKNKFQYVTASGNFSNNQDFALWKQENNFKNQLTGFSIENTSIITYEFNNIYTIKIIAAICSDFLIRIIDITNGHVMSTINTQLGTDLHSIQFSNLDKYLKVQSNNGNIQIWNIQDLDNPQKYLELSDYDVNCEIIEFSNDDKNLLVKNGIMDLNTQKITVNITLPVNRSIIFQKYSKDNQYILRSMVNQNLKVYTASTGQEIYIINDHKKDVNLISISNNHKLILTSSHDKTVKLFNIHTGALIKQVHQTTSIIENIDFSQDSKYIMIYSSDKIITIYDVGTVQILTQNILKSNAYMALPKQIFFTQDNNSIIYTYSNQRNSIFANKINIWNWRSQYISQKEQERIQQQIDNNRKKEISKQQSKQDQFTTNLLIILICVFCIFAVIVIACLCYKQKVSQQTDILKQQALLIQKKKEIQIKMKKDQMKNQPFGKFGTDNYLTQQIAQDIANNITIKSLQEIKENITQENQSSITIRKVGIPDNIRSIQQSPKCLSDNDRSLNLSMVESNLHLQANMTNNQNINQNLNKLELNEDVSPLGKRYLASASYRQNSLNNFGSIQDKLDPAYQNIKKIKKDHKNKIKLQKLKRKQQQQGIHDNYNNNQENNEQNQNNNNSSIDENDKNEDIEIQDMSHTKREQKISINILQSDESPLENYDQFQSNTKFQSTSTPDQPSISSFNNLQQNKNTKNCQLTSNISINNHIITDYNSFQNHIDNAVKLNTEQQEEKNQKDKFQLDVANQVNTDESQNVSFEDIQNIKDDNQNQNQKNSNNSSENNNSNNNDNSNNNSIQQQQNQRSNYQEQLTSHDSPSEDKCEKTSMINQKEEDQIDIDSIDQDNDYNNNSINTQNNSSQEENNNNYNNNDSINQNNNNDSINQNNNNDKDNKENSINNKENNDDQYNLSFSDKKYQNIEENGQHYIKRKSSQLDTSQSTKQSSQIQIEQQ